MRFRCTMSTAVRRVCDDALALGIIAAALTLTTAAIVPVLRNGAESVSKETSLRNLKLLATATRMYAMEYGEVFPGWVQNPEGKYAHNVWDEQIYKHVRRNDVYDNGLHAGYRSWADPKKQRVLSYGLNGLLICTPSVFNGSVRSTMMSNESVANPPAPKTLTYVKEPDDTILLAELATQTNVSSAFTTANQPYIVNPAPVPGLRWQAAIVNWIDISPREFVETGSNTNGAYDPATWDISKGIARDLWGGGGNYAFVDGHVAFLPIAETVGLGKAVTSGTGSTYVVTPGTNAWRADNYYNKWNPSR